MADKEANDASMPQISEAAMSKPVSSGEKVVMPLKKKASEGRGRPVQKRQEEDWTEIERQTEISDRARDLSPSSSSSGDDVPETLLEVITDTQIELSSEEESTVKQKRLRVSKKEIPAYKWTDEGTKRLAECIKDYPQLYDKRQKDWLNVAAKSQLWSKAGEQQEPPATGAQCKKQYENMRTRVGKIMKKEKICGTGKLERSMRDQEIMDTWNFLTQHIVNGNANPSEEVAVHGSGETVIGTDEEELDDDLSSAGSHVPHIHRKGKRIGRRLNPPSPSPFTTSSISASTSSIKPSPFITQAELSEAVGKILSGADSMGHTPTSNVSGQRKIVHDFACYLEGHMQAIPEDNWHDFEIDCLKLVQRFKKHGQATQHHHKRNHSSPHSNPCTPHSSRRIFRQGSSYLTQGSSHSRRHQSGLSAQVSVTGAHGCQLPLYPLQSQCQVLQDSLSQLLASLPPSSPQ